jgi:hypothetical protein
MKPEDDNKNFRKKFDPATFSGLKPGKSNS